jgi:hypothetical protein
VAVTVAQIFLEARQPMRLSWTQRTTQLMEDCIRLFGSIAQLRLGVLGFGLMEYLKARQKQLAEVS